MSEYLSDRGELIKREGVVNGVRVWIPPTTFLCEEHLKMFKGFCAWFCIIREVDCPICSAMMEA